MWGKLAPQQQREHFVPTLETPARTRAMPIGRNDEAERTHKEFFEKCRMRRITPQRYYFISVLPTFFGAHRKRAQLNLVDILQKQANFS